MQDRSVQHTQHQRAAQQDPEALTSGQNVTYCLQDDYPMAENTHDALPHVCVSSIPKSKCLPTMVQMPGLTSLIRILHLLLSCNLPVDPLKPLPVSFHADLKRGTIYDDRCPVSHNVQQILTLEHFAGSMKIMCVLDWQGCTSDGDECTNKCTNR